MNPLSGNDAATSAAAGSDTNRDPAPTGISQAVLLCALLAGSCFLAVYVRVHGSHPADDAFIFARVARSWLDTGYPYYNEGERLMGHSSHLWLLLMTALFRALGPGLPAMKVLSAASVILAFLLLTRLLARSYRTPWVAVAVAWAVIVLFVAPDAAEIMEAPLAVAMMLGAFISLDAGHDALFGLFSGLAFLTRYEMLALLVGGLLFAKHRGRYLMGAAGPCVVFTLFVVHYFNTLIPQPALAKRLVYVNGAAQMLAEFRFPFQAPGMVHNETLAVVAIVMGLSALHYARRRANSAPRWPLLAITVAFAQVAAQFENNAVMAHWYWPPILVPMVLGVLALPSPIPRVALATLLLLSLSPFLTAGTMAAWGLVTNRPDLNPELAVNRRVDQYLSLGRHLHETHGQATLLTSEIGGLGWGFYPGHIEDAAGLVSKDIFALYQHEPPHRSLAGIGITVRTVEQTRPDLIVSLTCFTGDLRPAIAAGKLPYNLVEQWPAVQTEDQAEGLPATVFGSRWLQVFARSGGSAEPGVPGISSSRQP
jgi:hypothetical protein